VFHLLSNGTPRRFACGLGQAAELVRYANWLRHAGILCGVCYASKLETFPAGLQVRPVYVGTEYDPTFGDDSRDFLAVPAGIACANHRRV
jgi:hypothetical protein